MLQSHSTVRSHVFRMLFMESVLNKGKLVNLSTGQYWLIFNGEKGMSDREGHGHKAIVYKSHFSPLRHSVVTETPADTLTNKPRLLQRPKSLFFMPPRQRLIRFILRVILKLYCGIIQTVIGLKLYNRGLLILLQIP